MVWLDSWDAFVKTVESGSMAAAARRLDCSRAQVSKLVADLERALGVRLLERTTRRLSLTPGGEVFYQHAQRVLEELREAELALQNMRDTPSGVVRITCSVSLGRLHVAPLLPQLAQAYPQLHCELDLNDRIADLVDEGFDLALRMTDAPSENVVARRLAPIRRVVCASPAYLAAMGIPQTPQDLAHHHCFVYAHPRGGMVWRFAGSSGEVAVAVRGKFQVNNADAILEAVLQGHGIAILPTYLCGAALARGALLPVLPGHEPITPFGRHVYACYPASRVQLSRLRVVLQALERHFGPVPPWERSPDSTSAG